MKIVVAMDSFKGSASAREACEAVRRGLLTVLPGAEISLRPMADGGEGTAATLLGARGGTWVELEVAGPLPDRKVRAGYARLEGGAAVVEMASASGIMLLEPRELDPLRTTTFGTGELLADALGGATTVWLTIGGSATVDGGVGAAQALGWRFLDSFGRDVPLGGAGLERIERIVPPEQRPGAGARIEVLCDVDNPLLGERGAARVFGPQKGATAEAVERLEAGLARLAEAIRRDLGIDVTAAPGGGAAGGLGAGAMAFLGAVLVSGIDAVMEASSFDDILEGADWVVTGEGRFDRQSLHGKVVSGVATRASAAGVRLAVLAGSVALGAEEARQAGIEALEAAAPVEMPLEEAIRRAPELIETAAVRLGERLPEPRKEH